MYDSQLTAPKCFFTLSMTHQIYKNHRTQFSYYHLQPFPYSFTQFPIISKLLQTLKIILKFNSYTQHYTSNIILTFRLKINTLKKTIYITYST